MAAGDRGRARPVLGVNKGLLELAGAPVFTHVLASLEQSPWVDRIYIVGPREKYLEALERPNIPFRGTKQVEVLQQRETLYQNIWQAFEKLLEDEVDREGSVDPESIVAMIVPCDIPLLVPEEVNEFVMGCDMSRHDYVVGITSSETLSRYYPQKHRRGIRLMCFHVREGSYRQNNLHLVRPLKVGNRHYIQKIYDYRLQREWSSIVRLLWEMFKVEEATLATATWYTLLHLAAMLHRVPRVGLYRIPAWCMTKDRLERSVSRLLRTRFSTVETHLGGAALDIDTPEHYGIIQENFEAWINMQREMARGGTKLMVEKSCGIYPVEGL
jgi:CTP:molybdopterin cytidylyltransferase MocA